jgi:hypothetical protein
MKKFAFLSLISIVLLGIAPLSQAAWHESEKPESDKTTAKEAGQETTDAAESIKNYTVEKRDEAAKKAKAALDDLDARINALEVQIDKNWDKMDKAAREKARNTMKTLHEQRVKVAEWYGGLQNSTASAWEHTKKGFSDAYKSLKTSWEKAAQEYQKDEKDKQK